MTTVRTNELREGAQSARASVGIIGLGAIGLGVARNLLKAGYSVLGCDPNVSACAAFVDARGREAPDPPAVAIDCSILLVCVFDYAQAVDVLFGLSGAMPVLAGDATVIMHTTMSPTQVSELAKRVEAAGRSFIDAPVTGGKSGADNGSLTIICSGSDHSMARARPVFEIYGARICYAGSEAGMATTLKMVNQLLTGVHLAAAAEAVAFAARAGVDPELAYDVITHGTGTSRAFETSAPLMTSGDFSPKGMVDIFTKDLAIVREVAADIGSATPLVQAALTQFERAAELGFGRADSAAVCKAYE
ncbi:MAG: putative dehydrogenase [Gammaproteobacteria bacterium]|jgi:putative dehydrogenase